MLFTYIYVCKLGPFFRIEPLQKRKRSCYGRLWLDGDIYIESVQWEIFIGSQSLLNSAQNSHVFLGWTKPTSDFREVFLLRARSGTKVTTMTMKELISSFFSKECRPSFNCFSWSCCNLVLEYYSFSRSTNGVFLHPLLIRTRSPSRQRIWRRARHSSSKWECRLFI